MSMSNCKAAGQVRNRPGIVGMANCDLSSGGARQLLPSSKTVVLVRKMKGLDIGSTSEVSLSCGQHSAVLFLFP